MILFNKSSYKTIVSATSTLIIAASLNAAHAQDWPTDKELFSILDSISHFATHKERALGASELLLGRPYVLGPCGEGSNGDFDKKPICSLQTFDCTTYVEPVLAFAFTDPTGTNRDLEFKENFLDIKYSDPKEITFVNRNHFTELHWIANAIQKKFLVDVTLTIDPNAPTRMKWLDVTGWYKGLEDGVNKNSTLSQSEKDDLINALNKNSTNKTVAPLAQLPYVPLATLLTASVQKKLKAEKILLFNLIKNEHTKTNVPVIVGHQGFIIEKNGALYLRHAAQKKETLDVLFTDYIQERQKDTTWPTLGMHFMRIVD